MPGTLLAEVKITSYFKRRSQNGKIAWIQTNTLFWHPHGFASCQESIDWCEREISILFIE
jgi:hypothetical protein